MGGGGNVPQDLIVLRMEKCPLHPGELKSTHTPSPMSRLIVVLFCLSLLSIVSLSSTTPSTLHCHVYFHLPPPSVSSHYHCCCYCPLPVTCCLHHLSSPSPVQCLIVVLSLLSSLLLSGVHHPSHGILPSAISLPQYHCHRWLFHADCYVLMVLALVLLLLSVVTAMSSSSLSCLAKRLTYIQE
jgi:hypothetical protein